MKQLKELPLSSDAMDFMSVFIILDDSVDKLVAVVGFCFVAISVVTSATTAMEVVMDCAWVNTCVGKVKCGVNKRIFKNIR